MKTLFAAIFAFIAFQAVAQDTAQSFYHNVVFRDFNETNKAKVIKALDQIVAVVESEEFRDAVLNFKDKNGNRAFLENNGYSNEEIYEQILDAAEKLRPTPDRTMDLDITWYYSWRSTVGYTYANSPRIWVNSKFYSKYDTAAISRNLFHEWTHKLGYGHVSSTKNRPWTVPYGLGSKMEELVRKRLKQSL